MKSINFPAFFDDFILAPSFKKTDIRQWFKEHENGRGVYAVFKGSRQHFGNFVR